MRIAHFFPNPRMAAFQRFAKNCTFLENRCDESVDLIYCGSVSQIAKAIKANQRFNKPLVCWVWDIPFNWRNWTRNEEEMKEHRWRENRSKRNVAMLRQCTKILSASKYTQRILKERYGLSSEQLYFYIHTEEFDSIQAGKNGDYIVQISRYALNKRFDISIKAIKGTGRELVCVGTGKYGHLKAIADELRADVTFHCKIKRFETIRILKQSTVLVSPSVFEGWGITPIEAIHCGKPILLSDLEVFRELWGDNALYHKKDDVLDMREKLERLLSDRRLQRRIVDTCRPLISEFTPKKFAERWKKAIQ